MTFHINKKLDIPNKDQPSCTRLLFCGLALLIVIKVPGHDVYAQNEDPTQLNAVIRNEAGMTKQDNDLFVSDILENRLLIQHQEKHWRYYGDARVWLLWGEVEQDYRADVMRSFIRYYGDFADVTLGKTYINFGIPSVFNPFDMDKRLQMADLAYDKQGIMALEVDMAFKEFSSAKFYSGMAQQTEPISDKTITSYKGGGALATSLSGIEFGLVANHKNSNQNIIGPYAKGDFLLGFFGGYGLHFNDQAEAGYSEANLGFDYSFLAGDLIMTVVMYYNEKGASSRDYNDVDLAMDGYFTARTYYYAGFLFIVDEFLNYNLATFVNAVDHSLLIMPSVNIALANGLTMTSLLAIATGKKNSEFSSSNLGDGGLLLRLEAKF